MYEAVKDWVRQPTSALLWWWAPLGLAIGLSSIGLPTTTVALAWATVFAWMGTGCALNAWRCRRLHCYISAPVFYLGAIASVLVATHAFHARLGTIVSVTLVLVCLSFLPEMIGHPPAHP